MTTRERIIEIRGELLQLAEDLDGNGEESRRIYNAYDQLGEALRPVNSTRR